MNPEYRTDRPLARGSGYIVAILMSYLLLFASVAIANIRATDAREDAAVDRALAEEALDTAFAIRGRLDAAVAADSVRQLELADSVIEWRSRLAWAQRERERSARAAAAAARDLTARLDSAGQRLFAEYASERDAEVAAVVVRAESAEAERDAQTEARERSERLFALSEAEGVSQGAAILRLTSALDAQEDIARALRREKNLWQWGGIAGVAAVLLLK